MALAMGHVMLREFHLDKPSQYFTDYVRRYTDMPMLVMLEEHGYYAAGRTRAADLVDALGRKTTLRKPSRITATVSWWCQTVQSASAGVKGKWNLEQRNGTTGEETELRLSMLGSRMRSQKWASRTGGEAQTAG